MEFVQTYSDIAANDNAGQVYLNLQEYCLEVWPKHGVPWIRTGRKRYCPTTAIASLDICHFRPFNPFEITPTLLWVYHL